MDVVRLSGRYPKHCILHCIILTLSAQAIFTRRKKAVELLSRLGYRVRKKHIFQLFWLSPVLLVFFLYGNILGPILSVIFTAIAQLLLIGLVQRLFVYDRNSEILHNGDSVYVFRSPESENIWASGVISELETRGAYVVFNDRARNNWFPLTNIAYSVTHDRVNP